MSQKRLIGAWVSHEDWTEYEKEHKAIFGHKPVIDLTGEHLCAHPMHTAITIVASQPGVGISLPFPFHNLRREDFLTDDEREINPEAR